MVSVPNLLSMNLAFPNRVCTADIADEFHERARNVCFVYVYN